MPHRMFGNRYKSIRNSDTYNKVSNFLNPTKIFFILIVICTLVYYALQIQKSKFDKKYTVALLVVTVFTLVGGLFIVHLRGIGPYAIFLILKILFLGGPLLTIFILNILIGQGKF